MTHEAVRDAVTGAARLVRGTPDREAVVSVCIPVYQGGRHLAPTLESVLAQTMPGVEIVVLDNASTDATPAVLAAVDDPRLVVWRNPATVPMVENFDRVVALASASMVKILPADDLLEPGALETLVLALASDPSLAMVAGRSHLVDAEGRLLVRDRFLRGLIGRHSRDAVVRRVVRHGANPVGGEAATIFRRQAFEAAGGYGTVGTYADVDLWLRLLEHGDFAGLETTVASFRIAGTTVSAAADRTTYRAQRAFTRQVAAAAGAVVRRRDLAASRVAAPLARRRRELLFALDRLRRAPQRPVAPASQPPSSLLPPPVRGVPRP
jgi:glycosyltransferase involved in cell wall biosynthesis